MSALSLRPRPGETTEQVIERVTSAAKEETVGKRIKRLRLQTGLSQRELQCQGLSYSYISRIEQGNRMPTIRTLAKIADKLNKTGKLGFVVSALYLLTGEFDHVCPCCGRGC